MVLVPRIRRVLFPLVAAGVIQSGALHRLLGRFALSFKVQGSRVAGLPLVGVVLHLPGFMFW